MLIIRRLNFSKKSLIPLGVILLVGAIGYSLAPRNPLQKYDICFKKNYVGLPGRLTEVIPVKCSNPNIVFDSPDVAVDYGKLRFADVDSDGIPEYIVEPSFQCNFEPCFTVCRIVVRVQPGNPPTFKIIERKPLQHLQSKPYNTDSCSR